MKHLSSAALCLCLAYGLPALAESAAEASGPVRPDDTEGERALSDGMAECAAILAVASTTSSNIIDRKRMSNAASAWFAASGDQSSSEGALVNPQAWAEKVSDWSGRIGSIDALSRQPDWMTYCASVGMQQGLGDSYFVDHAPDPSPDTASDTAPEEEAPA